MVTRHIHRVALRIFYMLCAMLFACCSFKSNLPTDVKTIPKQAIGEDSVPSFAINLPFLFYPERWYLNDSMLYVLNSKESPFLSVFNFSDNTYMQWGSIGNGPNEFIVPSLCKMKYQRQVGIYSNSLNKLVIYDVLRDTIVLKKSFHFPIWNEGRKLPKAYTRMIQFDDSLFVGTSFMPREIAVELLDLQSEKVVDTVQFPLQASDGESSAPYECKVDVNSDYLVAAYRYINRLEIFRLSSRGFRLETIIGDGKDQSDLYRLDKDDEMIYYYSDIFCGKDKIYALYQGTQVKDLNLNISKLEIYSMEGELLQQLNLGRSVESIVVDEKPGLVYAYDRNEENDVIYCYKINGSKR